MSDYPGGWFGKSWGAPVCDPETHLPTPVGDLCVRCAGEITDDDQGMIVPFAGMQPAVLSAHHLDCFLVGIIPCVNWTAELRRHADSIGFEHRSDCHLSTKETPDAPSPSP